MIFIMALTVAGCGSKEATVQETLSESVEASMNMESYRYEADIDFDVALADDQDPMASMVLSMINEAKFGIHGVVHQKPEPKAEMILDITIPGDMAMNITIPMIVDENQMWLKVPNIPMFIPQTIAGKYIQLDFEQLAEMSGEEAPSFNLDVQSQQKLSLELTDIINEHYAEGDYFQFVSADDIDLPVEAKQIVQLNITEDNLEAAVKTFVEKVLPDAIEVLSKPEYTETLQIPVDELNEMKQQLDNNTEQVNEQIAKLKEQLQINELSLTMALDDEKYIIHQALHADVVVKSEEENTPIKLDYGMTLYDINKDPEFELEIPAESDVIPMDEWMEMFGGVPTM